MPELETPVNPVTPDAPVPPTPPTEGTGTEGTETQTTEPTDTETQTPKRDRELARKWRKYNRQMEAFEAERKQFEDLKGLASTNPVEFLKKHGKTLEDWATAGVETPESRALSEVEKLRAERQQEKEEAESIRQQTQFERNQGVIAQSVEQIFDESKYTHIGALFTEGLLDKRAIVSEIVHTLTTDYQEDTNLQEELEDLDSKEKEALVAKWMTNKVQKAYSTLENDYQSQLVKLQSIIDKLKIAPAAGSTKESPNPNNGKPKPQTLTNAMSSEASPGDVPKFKTEAEVMEYIKKKNGWA